MVQLIPTCEYLCAVFAAVGEGSIEMHVLHVFPHVAPVRADLATHCALVASRTGFRIFDYVIIQLPGASCKQQQSTTARVLANVFIKLNRVLQKLRIKFMTSTYVMIQLVTTGKFLGAIFAVVAKGTIEVDIFNMLPKIAPVSTDFSTKGAFVNLVPDLRRLDNVFIQLLVASCKHQQSTRLICGS
jgi:hypothetical protein